VDCASLIAQITGKPKATPEAKTWITRSFVLSVTLSAVTIRPVSTSRKREDFPTRDALSKMRQSLHELPMNLIDGLVFTQSEASHQQDGVQVKRKAWQG
jgi:hypothetical protein